MSLEPETYDMPYTSDFYYGLSPGSRLVLEGSIPEKSKGFYFKLTTGQNKHADIALHFKADFQKAVVVLSCFKDRQWRKEKRLPSPWRPGQRFSILIEATKRNYKILTDGKLLDEFPHCLIPLKDVGILEMDGEVVLKNHVRPLYPE